jgi:hypothetical protein
VAKRGRRVKADEFIAICEVTIKCGILDVSQHVQASDVCYGNGFTSLIKTWRILDDTLPTENLLGDIRTRHTSQTRAYTNVYYTLYTKARGSAPCSYS